jgi:hypothetical protein
MAKVWKLGSSKSFPEFVKMATKKKLTSTAYIANATLSNKEKINLTKKRLKRMETVKEYTKPVNLNATIRMVHGKKVIADNKKSFEDMAEKYAKWLQTQKKK